MCKYVTFLVFNAIVIVSAIPQLDIDSFTKNENSKHFQKNDHSENSTNIIPQQDRFNEIGIDDTLHYDRDRSQRFGPPYTEENDRRYYNNGNNDDNLDYRSINRHPKDRFENINDDDDSKYYNQPQSPYFISENERNRYSYRENYSTVC